ncbi:ABC transporter substrate-binding protein [Dactylosporangium sp. AC04546]|uniref:ABC transporter substrate-binding protein n=1 Tax=Dactylosporangium sp. AC04546 TaxID=2862460 RepID=UPI001EDD8ADD|nr:ABC transporter substrate-binding protein [Dactylosporangium sp. AC04546]WVK80680.1 ABC transporter substrate-binding protein [Dactylosporangium sp. AC04546]
MNIDHERLDALRRGRGLVSEHVIDEFLAGRLSRRAFLRTGAVVGLSMPAMGAILSACGSAGTPSSPGRGKAGATIKAGCIAPNAAPNPLTVIDIGGIQMMNQVSQGLVFYDNDNVPQPWLASSWEANADATVWTFKIRQGVKFSDGSPMTVDDIVYTYQSHADKANASGALSKFAGLLDPSGVVKVDGETLQFHLQAPYGAFPETVSQANYNAVVVPKNTEYDKWAKSFIGTGPFMMKSFNQSSGATFVRNPHYWGAQALPESVQIVFYADEQPASAALQAGAIDVLAQFTVSNSPQLLNGQYNVNKVRGSSHRALSMRCDQSPLKDKAVRQAIALTLDRQAIVAALFKGNAQVGNDSPFAPSFPMTDKTVPQRERNLDKAKELLAQAGVPRGFSVELYTERLQEMPQFAQIVAESAAKIGVEIKLNVLTIADYYGDAVFGKSPWLDGAMSLVDYGAVPGPSTFLRAPLQSIDAKVGQGSWNAAHFDNPEYNALTRQYLGTVDVAKQRELAGKIQALLLDETPVIYPYFYDFLSASRANVFDVVSTAGQQLYLDKVSKS